MEERIKISFFITKLLVTDAAVTDITANALVRKIASFSSGHQRL